MDKQRKDKRRVDSWIRLGWLLLSLNGPIVLGMLVLWLLGYGIVWPV